MTRDSQRTTLSYEEKYRFYIHSKSNPTMAAFQVQEWVSHNLSVSISESTARRLKNLRESDFLNVNLSAKKARRVKFPQLEKQLVDFVQKHEGDAIITDDIMLEKARSLRADLKIEPSQCKLSNGWLHSFKKRNGLRSHGLHGEGGSVDEHAKELAQVELQELIDSYEPRNVFNFDETALFYRLPPNRTLASVKKNGKKKDKERLTLGLCCNLDGTEKIKPLVIGKSKKPRCFKNVDLDSKWMSYWSNNSAWMNTSIFIPWLKYFNLLMHGRRVLLLVDNVSSHLKSPELQNVTVHYLPPNMTSAVQPLDAGIIRSFKSHYKKRLVRWQLDAIEAQLTRKLNLLEAIDFCIESWRAVESEVIRRCWLSCNIVPPPMAAMLTQQNEYRRKGNSDSTDAELANLMQQMGSSLTVEEYIGLEDSEMVHSSHQPPQPAADGVEADSDSSDEDVVTASQALNCCMMLQSYFRLLDDQDSVRQASSMLIKARRNIVRTSHQLRLTEYFQQAE